MDFQTIQQVAQRSAVLKLPKLRDQDYSLDHYLHEITRDVCQLLNSDWTIITLGEGPSGQVLASNLPMRNAKAKLSLHGNLAALLIQNGLLCFIDEVEHQLDYQEPLGRYTCSLGIPLRTVHGKMIGTMYSFHQHPCQHTSERLSIVKLFAERAAMAIENHQLRQQQLDQQSKQEVAARTKDWKMMQSKLADRERLAEIGEFTTLIVHEVRNPLTTIEMGLNHAKKKLFSATDQQRLALALSESQRLKHLLNEILLYAKPQVLKLSKLNISAFLTELLVDLREMPEAAERSVELTHLPPEIYVLADVNKLKQVFINLVRNAFEAIHPGEKVNCEIVNSSHPEQICLNIHNNSDPIPPEILSQLTTPFCSTKPSGTGLGLEIVKRIVTAHGGELTINSSTAGITVSVQLPTIPKQ
ncbi:MAG: GAF domain-containing protein [Phormidium tanganyikae FI6-MK23]|jgi:signal transduction histidine kinase|nr:GAF domain-containing protein [Phormidium tanganyikae FI6-MK23]